MEIRKGQTDIMVALSNQGLLLQNLQKVVESLQEKLIVDDLET